MVTTTKTDKLIRALKGGGYVSTKALRARTGLANLSSTVHRLRTFGFDIDMNRQKNSKGLTQNYYRLA
jgi:biotin operon repressor